MAQLLNRLIETEGFYSAAGFGASKRSDLDVADVEMALEGNGKVDDQRSKVYDCGRTAVRDMGKRLNRTFC
jgi:hypothetical protein